ncbi:MAG TPA: HAD family hydrolase [Mycobacteriales bacterium]|nr:HAD family hydrolase [Mycobacteriales bacterium]
MTPTVFASDLDGTLVRSDGTVSARSRAAIAAVEAAGSLFVMVTGRPPRWMSGVAEAAGHRGLAICANGAVVYDLHTEQVVESHLLSADAAMEVVAALRSAVPGVAFARESASARFGHEPSYRPRWDKDDKDVLEVDDLVAEGVVKLLVRHEGMTGDELLAAGRAALGELVEATHSSADGLLEISARGVSKATGLAALAAQHGLGARDCVAFGDMPNDLPMLAWAARGVAVANAHPEVLAAADDVTASNDDDGVAMVIEALILPPNR